MEQQPKRRKRGSQHKPYTSNNNANNNNHKNNNSERDKKKANHEAIQMTCQCQECHDSSVLYNPKSRDPGAPGRHVRPMPLVRPLPWGAHSSAGICQPNIPALFGAPALLGISASPIYRHYSGHRHYWEYVPAQYTGTIQATGTVGNMCQPDIPALFRPPALLG